MEENLIALVKATINEVLSENALPSVPLEGDTNILKDTPLDSMGLAIVVTKIEEATGVDPFEDGFILFQTINELAALYEKKN
jgi:acyl carrier protein